MILKGSLYFGGLHGIHSAMTVVDLLRLVVTGLFVWLLRPHLALLWRFALPGRVRHALLPQERPPEGLWKKMLEQAGFKPVGFRRERIPLLENRGFFVFHHSEGVYADVPEQAFFSPRKQVPTGLYLTTWLPDTLFLITKRVGGNIHQDLYVSQKRSGSLQDMMRAHRATLLQLGLGQNVDEPGTCERREEIFRLWHARFARIEQRNFAVLSFVLSIIMIVFLIRMWMI